MSQPKSLEARLRAAQRAFDQAEGRSEQLRIARDKLVAQALAENWPHARIAAATGLSRGRIGQLATRTKAQNQ